MLPPKTNWKAVTSRYSQNAIKSLRPQERPENKNDRKKNAASLANKFRRLGRLLTR
jgi:hypothetical protein